MPGFLTTRAQLRAPLYLREHTASYMPRVAHREIRPVYRARRLLTSRKLFAITTPPDP